MSGSAGGRVGIVAARFNETVTARLVAGAEACLRERGIGVERTDVQWVAGAWEIPVVISAMLAGGGYEAVCAIGAVIRGDTPHFEYIAGETARGLMALQVEFGVPVGFGVLTCDTMEQAVARAGGDAGNKGFEAMDAALGAAFAIEAVRGRP